MIEVLIALLLLFITLEPSWHVKNAFTKGLFRIFGYKMLGNHWISLHITPFLFSYKGSSFDIFVVIFFIVGKADILWTVLYNFRFFFHIGLEYLFTFWTCFLLYKEYDHVASMRLRFLSSQNRRAEQFTVRYLLTFATIMGNFRNIMGSGKTNSVICFL